ncbi:hypothetical protein ACFSC4_27120 [Deinococcus malanensis]|uniref:hypothetical protein n=1 Tax=Deinococcus malanensis TaxID=1706855 RepID=UPI003638EB9C
MHTIPHPIHALIKPHFRLVSTTLLAAGLTLAAAAPAAVPAFHMCQVMSVPVVQPIFLPIADGRALENLWKVSPGEAAPTGSRHRAVLEATWSRSAP